MAREKKLFTLMPEGCDWITIQAYTAETAYALECCWFSPSRKIAVLDNETGEVKVFIRNNWKHIEVDMTKEHFGSYQFSD